MKTCIIPDCSNKHMAKGVCNKHYYKLRRYGIPGIKYDKKECIVENCTNPVNAKNLCSKHYSRNKVYGDPNIVRFPWREDRSCSIPNCLEEHEAKGFCKKHYMVLRKFNISLSDYIDKLKNQGGLCKICNQECSHGKALSLDHDHDTGQIRDLLCASCNLALGGFKDNPEMLRSALKYLERWGKK
jgi:hypothetical protein